MLLAAAGWELSAAADYSELAVKSAVEDSVDPAPSMRYQVEWQLSLESVYSRRHPGHTYIYIHTSKVMGSLKWLEYYN